MAADVPWKHLRFPAVARNVSIHADVMEHGFVKAAELCCKHGISAATFYNWKAKYGGMTVSEVARLRTLEDENRRLKKLLAESMLDVSALENLLKKLGRSAELYAVVETLMADHGFS